MSWVWWACLLGFLITSLIGAKALWDSKKAPYFILREEAATRAQRVALIALALLAVSVSLLLWGKPGPLPSVETTPTPMPTSTSIPTTPVPTLMPSPTFTPIPVPTHTGQVPPPTTKPPTSTPSVGAEASFEALTLARGVSEEHLPLEPGNVFPKGTKRVYAFFTYREMERGMPWSQVWYREGEEVWSQASLWRRDREGIAWVYMELSDGFSSGEYEVRLYIDRRLQQRVEFTVRPVLNGSPG